MVYKTSYYNFYAYDKKKRMGVIYNARKGSIVQINELNLWNAILENRVNQLSEDEKNMLAMEGVLLGREENELEKIKEQSQKYVRECETLFLTILPTETCNMKCAYCFLWEKTPIYMSEHVHISLIEFMEKQLANCNIKRVMLNWFGGEPTLCVERIISFMSDAKEVTRKKGVTLQSSMTTNGYLLTKDVFLRLYDAGIKQYQITLDGIGTVHNISRPLKSGKDSYSKIVDNLFHIRNLDGKYNYSIDIRANFTKKNLKSIENLIVFFKKEFSEDERFHMYCRPVYKYETKKKEIEKMENDIFTLEEGLEKQTYFANKISAFSNKEAIRRIVASLPQPTKAWCNAEIYNSYIVGPEGQIYICDTLIGEDKVIGKIENGDVVKYKEARYDIFSSENTKKCVSCKLLPICMGGCLRNRIDNEANCYWSEEGIQSALNEYLITL